MSRSTSNFRGFLGDVSSLFSTQLIVALLGFFIVFITARALGAEGRGIFAVCILLPSLLITFTDFGIATSGPKFVAEGNYKPTDIFGSQTVACAIRIVVTLLIGFVVIACFSEIFLKGIPRQLLIIGLFQIVPISLNVFILPLLLGVGHARRYSMILLFGSLASGSLITAAWLLDLLTVRSALFLELLAGLASMLVVWFWVRPKFAGVLRVNLNYLKEAYAFGLGVYTTNVAIFANTRVVWLLINYFVGPAAVGIYTIAQVATEKIYLFADALGTILLPRISAEPENSSTLTPIVFRIALTTSLVGGGCLAATADWLIVTFFTESFVESVAILRMLVIGVVFTCCWRVLFQDLNARGYSWHTAWVNIGTAVVNLSLSFVLIEEYGVIGVAFAGICASLLSLVLGMALYANLGSEHPIKKVSLLFKISTIEREAFRAVSSKFLR